MSAAKPTPTPWCLIERRSPSPDHQPTLFICRGSASKPGFAIAEVLRGGERAESTFRDEIVANGLLLLAAPDLLNLAHQYASECAECDGVGTDMGEPEIPCPACADIRAVIARAEGTS